MANGEIEREIESLKDGHAYESAGQVLARVIKSLVGKKTDRIICRQLKVQDDITDPLRRYERLYLNG